MIRNSIQSFKFKRKPLNFNRNLILTTSTLIGFGGYYYKSKVNFNKDSSLKDDDLKSLPSSQLFRSWLVYSLCSSSTLIDLAPDLLTYASKVPIVWQLTKFLVRNTFFAQFTGGETPEEYLKVIEDLRNVEMGVILNYSAEASDISPSSADSLKDATNESLNQILTAIETCGAFEKRLRDTNDRRAGQTYVAVKPSGLILDPYVLERATTALNAFHGHDQNSGPAQLPTIAVDDSDMQLVLDDGHSLINSSDIKQLKDLHSSLRKICSTAYKNGVKILIDAEYGKMQPAIDVMFTLLAEEFNYDREESISQTVQPVVYNTIQCSLRRSEPFIDASIKRAELKGYSIGFKVVRGAYVDHERSRWSKLKGLDLPPVWSTKDETDDCYNTVCQNLVKYIASSQEANLSILFASHNAQSSFKVLELLEEYNLAERNEKGLLEPIPRVRDRIAFGQLYGKID